jgi:hypothetical protein
VKKMTNTRIERELSSVRLELNNMNRQLSEIRGIIQAITVGEGGQVIEPLSLGQFDTGEHLVARALSNLPEWATRTYAAVKEISLRNLCATAAEVANLTKKTRNTESSRLVILVSKGLLASRRKGRHVMYLPKARVKIDAR